MAQQELEKQVDVVNDRRPEEITDIDERTAEFYKLKEELYQYVLLIPPPASLLLLIHYRYINKLNKNCLLIFFIILKFFSLHSPIHHEF